MDLERRLLLGLSPREAETLELAADGLTDKQVALRLNVGPATVRTFWNRIRAKLDAVNRAQAIARALGTGYPPDSDRPMSRGLTALMENPDLGVAIVDMKGRVLDANDTYLRLIGYSQQDLEQGKIHWDQHYSSGI